MDRIIPRLGIGLVMAVCVTLAGCASVQPTNRAAVAYNRDFAKARDETILLNVLRASASQPLQFSTISNVSGGVHTGITLGVPFTNLLAGGKDAISPEIELTARNPTVQITPLERFRVALSQQF